MTATDVSPNESQTAVVCGLLREYAAKLDNLLSAELGIDFGSEAYSQSFAYWLDQVERLKRPLLRIVSRASQALEHLDPDPLEADELALRLAEIEPLLHQTFRRFNHWRDRLANDKRLRTAVEPLRMAAGLPGE